MRIAGKRVDRDERIEVRNPYNGAVGRHGAGGARRSMCARPSPRPRPTSRSSPATSASRSCCAPPNSCATARKSRPAHHRGVRAVPEGFALRGRPRLRRLSRWPARWRSATTARSIPATSLRTARRASIYHHAHAAAAACISAITPFNHPLNMVSHKIAPAIATNNRVVLKPTELTPLTALLLADILYEAGLPPEMLSVVTGNPSHHGRRDDHRPGRRPHHLHRLGARSASTSPRRPATGASCWSSAATIR